MKFRKGPRTNNAWSEEKDMDAEDVSVGYGVWAACIGTDQRESVVQVEIETSDFEQLLYAMRCIDQKAFSEALLKKVPFEEIRRLIEFWLTGHSRELALQMFAQAIITTNPH